MSRLQDLPTLHPSLTLHLSDKADTPIISSAPPPAPPPLTSSQSQSQQPQQSSSSLSPPQPQQPRSHHPRPTRSAAIASLNRSALASYAAAARFGLGNPVRIMVECVPTYPGAVSSSSASGGGDGIGGGTITKGPMVLNTYIPPLPQPAAAAVAQANGTEAIENQMRGASISQQGTSPGAAGVDMGEDADGDGAGSNRPPLLVAVVVAPDGESQTVADARLAASRLARVGRRLQAQWAEEDGGQNGEG
ncbi:hypothetical protein GE09DRAFT_1123143 [Coniochaeta sp. 2T2.1]|nr:hypothetical protein GE09DRAFT_1123143 [Coniochaeta sp. 2T2.1]